MNEPFEFMNPSWIHPESAAADHIYHPNTSAAPDLFQSVPKVQMVYYLFPEEIHGKNVAKNRDKATSENDDNQGPGC